MSLKSFVVGIVTKDGWELPARLAFPTSLTCSVVVPLVTNIYYLLNGKITPAVSASVPGYLDWKKYMTVFSFRRGDPSGIGGNKITGSHFLGWVISWFSTEIAGKHLLGFSLVPSSYLTLNSEEGTLLPCWTPWLCFCGVKQVSIS